MDKIKEFFNKNKKAVLIGGGAVALLVIVGIVLALVLGGNGAAMNGCTVELKTEGGMPLSGIGVYIYENADKAEMVSFAKTDETGKVTFSAEIPEGSVIVLDGVPAGYVVAENYPITAEEIAINLHAELLKEMTQIKLGNIMFDFTVTDTDGTAYTLSELLKEKKAVVLNLWYTNCQPCKMEFPYLQKAYEAYGEQIALLAMDPVADDSEDAIKTFKTENGLTLPMAKVDAAWAEQIQGIAYPTTVVIDRYGMISLIHTGAVDNAKTFKDAFAFFTAEDYVQTAVSGIKTLLKEDSSEEEEETTATPETTVPSTTAPTEPEETKKPNGSSGSSSGSNSGSSGSSSGSSANYDGTLVNPDEPVEQFGYNDFSIDVGAGEKKLVYMVRLIGKATLRIKDKDAYVVYKEKTYKPDKSGVISISMSSDQPNAITEMQFGNSGNSNKTFKVTFVFAKGSRENPNKLEVGQTTVKCASGNDQGTFCTFKASKAGTLTVTVVSVSPSTVICGITISDMQAIPNVVELQEGENTVSIELPAGATAELTFFTRDPNKEWKIPAADIKVDVAFS